MSKQNIKKGDIVYVLAGDDRGKQGRVLSVQVSKNRATVEGINMVSKSTKPSAKYPQGGIIKIEAPSIFQTSPFSTPSQASPPASDVPATRKESRSEFLKNQERRLNNGQRNTS